MPQDQPLTLPETQSLIREMFGAKDASRGIEGTFMWFLEEVGELATALRHQNREERDREDRDRDELRGEFADCLAWLATLANIAEVDLDEALRAKYGAGCPRCGQTICQCAAHAKP